MKFGARLCGYVYSQKPINREPEYAEFDIDEFFDRFLDFIEANGFYFGGGMSRVDLDQSEGSDGHITQVPCKGRVSEYYPTT